MTIKKNHRIKKIIKQRLIMTLQNLYRLYKKKLTVAWFTNSKQSTTIRFSTIRTSSSCFWSEVFRLIWSCTAMNKNQENPCPRKSDNRFWLPSYPTLSLTKIILFLIIFIDSLACWHYDRKKFPWKDWWYLIFV